MIVFLGDSFTFGQGLQIPHWLEQGKSIDEINESMPPKVPSETYDYNSDKIRQIHHFPNLVSKHFNKSYVTKFGNGGSNENIISILNNLGEHMDLNGIDFIVIQFTELFRNHQTQERYYDKINSGVSADVAVRSIVKEVLHQVSEEIKNIPADFKWFGLSWKSEIGNYLKHQYPDNFIPIHYGEEEFVSFDSIMENHYNLTLGSKYGVHDLHLTSEGHQIIADSIIKKINLYL